MVLKYGAYVVSLNFDGLTTKALQQQAEGRAISLHTAEEILNYFCATRFFHAEFQEPPPAVIKVRGDVFYARCTQVGCPWSTVEYPIDRLALEGTQQLRCPHCSADTLRLRFSFPGYRAKEEAAYPTLWITRRFIASRISCIIILGLSGRWDRYLLDFIFDLALERRIPVVDVKPDAQEKEKNPIDNFRATYYPSIVRYNDASKSSITHKQECYYIPIATSADDFASALRQELLSNSKETRNGLRRQSPSQPPLLVLEGIQ